MQKRFRIFMKVSIVVDDEEWFYQMFPIFRKNNTSSIVHTFSNIFVSFYYIELNFLHSPIQIVFDLVLLNPYNLVEKDVQSSDTFKLKLTSMCSFYPNRILKFLSFIFYEQLRRVF